MTEQAIQTGVQRSAFQLPAPDAMGLKLHLRHVRPEQTARGTVVFIHGATLASGLWDIDVPGCSVLQTLALEGWSTWAPDLRGYARSGRLAGASRPYCGHSEAVVDISAVLAHACETDGVDGVVLVGGSWGSITAALCAVQHPDRVVGLVLVAPIHAQVNLTWLRDLAEPHERTKRREPRSATRWVSAEQLRERCAAEVLHGDLADRIAPGVLEALTADALAAEPNGSHGQFEVPNGALDDLFEVFSGRALFDPADLRMPVLLVRGEHDVTSTDDDVRRLFAALGSRDKQYLQIGEAGHFLCAERRAPGLISALKMFCARVGLSPQ